RGTPDAAYIDVDVRVAPDMTVSETAAITDSIRERLHSALDGVEEVEVHYQAAAPERAYA
ncbi:MAG: cation transporter dimerization domain-containing protein, partial [Aggregatilineales bacterium]